MKDNNVLVFSCSHLPFEHKYFLEFLKEQEKKYKCKTVVHLGDNVDLHSVSYHEHDPNGWSPLAEMEETDKHLKPWFKAFPKVSLCKGNHDNLVDRKSKTVGLPRRAFKPYRDIWKLPKGWVDRFEFEFDGVLYKHGTGCSGKYGHVTAAVNCRQSVVIGHLHSVLGVEYIVSSKDRIFGMCVGCGIDQKRYAFAYGKDFKRKPILGCGVVVNNGQDAFPIAMKME